MEHLKEKIQDEFQAKFNKLQEDMNKVANEVANATKEKEVCQIKWSKTRNKYSCLSRFLFRTKWLHLYKRIAHSCVVLISLMLLISGLH